MLTPATLAKTPLEHPPEASNLLILLMGESGFDYDLGSVEGELADPAEVPEEIAEADYLLVVQDLEISLHGFFIGESHTVGNYRERLRIGCTQVLWDKHGSRVGDSGTHVASRFGRPPTILPMMTGRTWERLDWREGAFEKRGYRSHCREQSAISHQRSAASPKKADMKDFRKLKVWLEAHELVLSVYRATAGFPSEERYGLTSQLRRASVSIPANLAEGCGRHTDQDFARFVDYAMGSASEVEYHLLLARDLGLLDATTHAALHGRTTEVKRMLASFLASLRADR